MRVIVSAGGTGGHIFPALAIVNKILEEEPDSKVLYIGNSDRMESKIVPERGIDFVGLEMKGLDRKHLLNNFKTISCLINAKRECKKIIKEFKPDIVLGIGGYITYPVISTALKCNCKTFIHEQNSIIGLSNKLLMKKVDAVGVSLEDSLKYFNGQKNVFYTGNPRSEEAYLAKPGNKGKYGLSKNKKLVMIVMGSLGSKTINDKMKYVLSKFNSKDYEVLFVTGKNHYDEYKNIDNLPKNVKVVEFVDDMLNMLKCTDLIISRAGASTIAEITTVGLPSILIPSPFVTHNHQYMNAKVLEDANASVIIEEKDFDGNLLINSIDNILNDSKKYKEMKEANESLGIKNSTTKIYKLIRKIIDGDLNG